MILILATDWAVCPRQILEKSPHSRDNGLVIAGEGLVHGGKQLGHRFAEGFAYGGYEESTAKKRTNRESSFSEMKAVVPWQALI